MAHEDPGSLTLRMAEQSRFTIIREDLTIDPVTILTEGLMIGRQRACELSLVHPTVSRVHAGIKKIGSEFFLFNLRPTNSTLLNGRNVERGEVLATGDMSEIGPFILRFEVAGDQLKVRVALQIGAVSYEATDETDLASTIKPGSQPKAKKPLSQAAATAVSQALDIYWSARIREAGKMARPTPLHPHEHAASGKKKFLWKPTTDLGRSWPFSLFTWGAVAVAALSVIAVIEYANAFSPAPISAPHSRTRMASAEPIAKNLNSSACTSCHSKDASLNDQCASCHETQAFQPLITDPHRAAGIGCVACHSEHKGPEYRPALASLEACVNCHNDKNKKLYNGMAVHTPHGGTFGYPVSGGQWVWEGLTQAEWDEKKIPKQRPANADDNLWRRIQFHEIHSYRIRAANGVASDPGGTGRLACNSCHQWFRAEQADVATPRTTCAKCHNGVTLQVNDAIVTEPNAPNCVSCHVQHMRDPARWGKDLVSAEPVSTPIPRTPRKK